MRTLLSAVTFLLMAGSLALVNDPIPLPEGAVARFGLGQVAQSVAYHCLRWDDGWTSVRWTVCLAGV